MPEIELIDDAFRLEFLDECSLTASSKQPFVFMLQEQYLYRVKNKAAAKGCFSEKANAKERLMPREAPGGEPADHSAATCPVKAVSM